MTTSKIGPALAGPQPSAPGIAPLPGEGGGDSLPGRPDFFAPDPGAYGLPDARSYGLPDAQDLLALASGSLGSLSGPAPAALLGAMDPQAWDSRALELPLALGEAEEISPAISPALFRQAEGGPQVQPPGPGRPGEAWAARPLPYVGHVPVAKLREDFPILSTRLEGGKPLVWFDNAATTQKPQAVIERLARFYRTENSNVHRGAHALAARATDAYEEARSKVAAFIGAPSPDNIVWVRGTTEGLNLVAQSFAKPRLSPGDEIILSVLEHHANIVPWQIVAAETGALLRVAPVDDSGQIILADYQRLFNPRTRFVSLAQVSNALGTVLPIAEMVAIAKGHGVPVAVDGAQSVSHIPVNVAALGCDFFVFSGHKIYGPTGIGALYGTDEALEEARPYQGGGNMIADVTFEKTLYRSPPLKFEAGTGNIAGAVGLGAALDYVSAIGLSSIAAYEESLLSYATEAIRDIPGLRLVGTAARKASVLSFVIEGKSPEEVGQALSQEGIAVRAGHHCAQPGLRRFGLEGTVRPSLAFYNTSQEVEAMAAVLWRLAGR